MAHYPVPKPKQSKRINNKAKRKGEGRKAQQRRAMMKLYMNFVRPAFMAGLAAGQRRRGLVPLCERCGERVASQVHHMAGRLGDALLDAELFAGLCPGCHDWVHDHPADARAQGWMEARYSRSPNASRREVAQGLEDSAAEHAAAEPE